MNAHGVTISPQGIWIRHRRTNHGPFDYQWSLDLFGVELIYQGQKFGECCGGNQVYADLSEFQLPMTVVRVASIVLGTTVRSILQGEPVETRIGRVQDELRQHGFDPFADETRFVSETAPDDHET